MAWEYKAECGSATRFLVVEDGQVVGQGDGELVDPAYFRPAQGPREMTVATFDRLRVLVAGLTQAACRGRAVTIQFSPSRVYGVEELLQLAGDHPLNPVEEPRHREEQGDEAPPSNEIQPV